LTLTEDSFPERDLLAIPGTHGRAGSEASDQPPNPGPVEHQKQDVTIILKIAPEMTYRVLDEFGEAEKQPDGSFIVTVTWPEDDWVYGFIMSFGEHIEILEPEYLREVIKNKLLRSVKKYL
jgi:predicted DNA-binding transcriptional regulator YafY